MRPRPATIVLVLLLALPAVAWVLGARQPLLENRERIPYPDLNRGTLQQAATFEQIDSAYLDRLPLRGEAIDLNARMNIDLFRDSPNPEVAIGSDGWLYFVPSLQACAGRPPLADPADAVEILARALVASGRRTLVTMPGGKFTLQPEHAPDVDEDVQSCVAELENAMGERLGDTPGGADIDASLRAILAEGDDVYLKGDTHWNDNGREEFARTVLNAIRPGLAREVGLHQGREIDRPGDLWKLMGLDRTERDRIVVARRTPAKPPEDVLLLGDSQLEFAFTRPPAPGVAPLIERALPGAQTCAIQALAAGGCDAQIAAAKTIVYEDVSRNIRQFTEICWRPVSLAIQGLRGPRGAFERVDGGTDDATAGGGLAIPANTAAEVRVRVPGADRADVARAVTIPVAEGDVTVIQQPQGGPSAPCATPSAAAGSALVLPVSAGRRASDLVLSVSSTSGARLEAPTEVSLADDALTDGR